VSDASSAGKDERLTESEGYADVISSKISDISRDDSRAYSKARTKR
jgi:hypothetical protein